MVSRKRKIFILIIIGMIILCNILRFGVTNFEDQKIIYFGNFPFSDIGYVIGSYSIKLEYGDVELKTGCEIISKENKLWVIYLTNEKNSLYNINILDTKIENISCLAFSNINNYFIVFKIDSDPQEFIINENKIYVTDIIVKLNDIEFATKDFSINIVLKDDSRIYSEIGAKNIEINFKKGIYSFTIPRGGYEKEYFFIREYEGIKTNYNIIRLNDTWDQFIEGIKWEPRE
jgi:hypothetical protein